MRIETLETPVPVVDLEVVDANIHRMQTWCDTHRLRLRPHVKTHKLPWLAHRQLRAGAQGIAAQKLAEAEVMAMSGIDDILLTYNVIGEAKVERLARLAQLCRMQVALDNPHAVRAASRAAQRAGVTVPVLIEFDSGGDRTGVRSAQEALSLARFVTEQPGLRLAGLMTHPFGPQVEETTREIRTLLTQHGLGLATLSVGGTPTAKMAHRLAGVTELRVGTYVYNDRMMVHAGVAKYQDCALHIYATVVSTPSPDRVILDAGSKTLSSDLIGGLDGYGYLPEFPDATLERLNEEHAIVDVAACSIKPTVGQCVRILPNHVCVVSNLHDQVVWHRRGEILMHAAVLARGTTR